ncbi:ROK family transcriptional regulator [Halobacillus salinarum]|uniref:ROK family transcriptional regulator n=1 Tax=Halobacillus salinarum TaxID=2932257 RepID=A0ABY4ENM5_9BACI|nr:ROK family transcriptional regulator [Halobacillus salinarum]UOQ45438.1 ROK family transcriptional regulator [Halobacillus salinarum]
MLKTGGLKLMQEINQYIVLRTIREEGPISRSEIAKKTKLSPTTVTSAVSELLQEGIVVTGGTGESSGGRKPTYLQFAPDSKFLIGVSITNSHIEIGTLNLEAEVQDKLTYEDDFQVNNQVIEETLRLIRRYLSGIDDLSNCIGISLIVPGIVDSKRGIIRNNAKLNLKDIALKEMIEKEFGLETWIDNDANAIALAETNFGSYEDKKNLVYIQMGDGIGSGIVIEDVIFRGAQGGAGEFGHISIDKEGIQCECGNRGCLENYVNWPALLERIKERLEQGESTSMLAKGKAVDELTQEDFLKALQQEDELAQAVIEDPIQYMGNGIVTLVNLFNPEVVLVGWGSITSDSYFIKRLRERVNDLSFAIFTENLEIQATTLGGDFQLKGAASVALKEYFEVPV